MLKRKFEFLISIPILLVLVSYPILSTSSGADLIQIRIWTEKNEYLTREPIIVNYAVKNIADRTVRLNFLALSMYFDIKDQDGKGYANKLYLSFGFAYPDSLEPGESYESGENITDGYGVVFPGEYTCVLNNPSPEAKSNIITIKVKDAKGDEKKALNLYLEAEKLKYTKDKDPKKRELGFLKYQELADKYPRSVYAPLSLASARGVYRYSINLEERSKIIPVCKRLIEQYPKSLYFMSAFTSLVEVYEILKDKEGAIKTMKELIEKHPNTKISERAEYWLKQIEKWEFK